MAKRKRPQGDRAKGTRAHPEHDAGSALRTSLLKTLPPALRRWRESIDRVEARLLERLEEVGPSESAVATFFEPLVGVGTTEEGWSTYALVYHFYDWRAAPGARTLAEQVLERGARLGEDERSLLAVLSKTPPSLHEVIGVDPGRGVVLRDRFREGGPVFVEGADHALMFDAGELLAARVIRVGPYHTVSLLFDPVPDDAAPDALTWLETRFREFASAAGTLDREAFLLQHPVRVPQAAMMALARRQTADWDDEEVPLRVLSGVAPKKRKSPSNKLYELEVTLLECSIPIRRVIQVSGDRTLADLHHIVQAAMGWTDTHLHAFRGAGGDWQCADPDQEVEGTADESQTTIAEAAPRKGSRFYYEYDFGDGWEHEIRVLDRRGLDPTGQEPVCVGGEGACPPEDSGGPIGYEWKLEVLQDRRHEEYAETAAWMGRKFDPTHFNVAAANARIHRRLL